MNSLGEVIDLVCELENQAQGNKKNFFVSTENIISLCDFFIRCSNSDKGAIYQRISGKTGLLLISHTGVLAAKAIDEDSKQWLVRALVLHVIEGFRYDYRENIRRLAFVFHAADRINIDFSDLVKEVLILADPSSAKRLTEFCDRDPSLNLLKVFGMKEVKVKGSTKFIPI